MQPSCPKCDDGRLEPRKTVVQNEVVEDGWYCPECEHDFDSSVKFEWDEIDFPVWLSVEHYEDNWELWDRFLRETGLHESQAKHLKNMKYTVFSVWFKVTSNGKVKGPYEHKHDEETLDL